MGLTLRGRSFIPKWLWLSPEDALEVEGDIDRSYTIGVLSAPTRMSGRFFLSWSILLLAGVSLHGEILFVPGKFASIESAIAAAAAGDVVEVDNGYYFEGNIVLDKAITLRAKNTFQAVIHGETAGRLNDAIFIVRAPVLIEGFILKNGTCGIVQRGSPDVAWSARNLAVLNMKAAAISINAAGGNIGSGIFSGIIIDNCGTGFGTNDANSMSVSNCLVANCSTAFAGYDHISFRVEKATIWGCRLLFGESEESLPDPKTSAITRVGEIEVLDPAPAGDDKEGLLSKALSSRLWATANGDSLGPIGQGLVLAIAGDVHNRFQAFTRSIQFYQAALSIGQHAGSDEVVWRACTGLALAYERLGDDRAALEHYRKAVLLMESLRGKLPMRYFNPGFFRDKSQVYVSLIHQLAEMHKKEPLPAYLEEAFAVAEKSRARGFLDSLEEAGLDFASTISSDVVAEGKRLSAEVSRYQVELQTQDLSPSRRADLLVELERIENAYRDLLIRMRREAPAYASLHYPGPTGFQEARTKLLAEGTALVEFVLGEECSFAFWATRDSLSLSLLPPADKLRPLVKNYLKFLTLKDPPEFLAEEGGCRLFEILLGPFRDRLGKEIKRIIIIPDGYLNYLPFESLMIGKVDGRKSRFLIEDYEVSYAPSASALVRLMERDRYQTPRKGLLAIFAPKLPVSKNYLFGYPVELFELKHARREIAAISGLFGRDQRTILEGKLAAEEVLKRLYVGDYRFIHFAVHGIFDDQNWRWSGLLLWRGKDSVEDGILQLRDIFLLTLHSDLVVLSACQTGKGELETGEGIIGLTGGFLFAGSRAVLVSLWNIADRSTAAFMEGFYRHLMEGESVSRALQNAKLEMIRSPYRHPYYWAAFSLIGDSQSYSISK
jgi:tetratricopeptide (TPR) repeat protein